MTRIFDEELAVTDCVIAVISKNSLGSAWVERELSVATVKMINRVCRVIPIVLDDVKVPTALSDLLYIKIEDPQGYDDEYQRLLSSLFNRTAAPPVGGPPSYVATASSGEPVSDLPPQAVALLKKLVDASIANGQALLGSSDQISEICMSLDMDEGDIVREFERLSNKSYLEYDEWRGSIHHASINPGGFLRALELKGEDLKSLRKSFVAAVLNHECTTIESIASHIDRSPVVVNAVADELQGRGLLEVSRAMGGYRSWRLDRISPLLGEELG